MPPMGGNQNPPSTVPPMMPPTVPPGKRKTKKSERFEHRKSNCYYPKKLNSVVLPYI